MHDNATTCEGGRLLLSRLRRRGVTLRAAESQLGVSAGYLSKILRGNFTLDSLSIALRVYDLWRVPLRSWGKTSNKQEVSRES
jgi:transcriptional regulator with XRE-family HTH domain